MDIVVGLVVLWITGVILGYRVGYVRGFKKGITQTLSSVAASVITVVKKGEIDSTRVQIIRKEEHDEQD